jgi:hypothetical protein
MSFLGLLWHEFGILVKYLLKVHEKWEQRQRLKSQKLLFFVFSLLCLIFALFTSFSLHLPSAFISTLASPLRLQISAPFDKFE